MSVLDDLGLVANTSPRHLTLANGVELDFRPPEGVDWSLARTRVSAAFDARDALAMAAGRYGWSDYDSLALLDPDRWHEASVFCTAVELAPLIVTRVGRTVKGEARTVPPTVETFAVLFKHGDSLDRFWRAAKLAGEELITAKKEPASSPDTSSGAGRPLRRLRPVPSLQRPRAPRSPLPATPEPPAPPRRA